MLIALLVCLIPTTIGGLLSAIGIAGMDRMIQQNVIAMSGRAVEAAGDVNTLLLDKTGTITLGNRQAVGVPPGGRRRPSQLLADRAQLASLADETPEGRSIVVLAKKKFGTRAAARSAASTTGIATSTFVPFSATTRMSGVNAEGLPGAQGRRRRGARVGASRRAASTPADLETTDSARREGGRHAARRRREGRRQRQRRRACSASSTSRTS